MKLSNLLVIFLIFILMMISFLAYNGIISDRRIQDNSNSLIGFNKVSGIMKDLQIYTLLLKTTDNMGEFNSISILMDSVKLEFEDKFKIKTPDCIEREELNSIISDFEELSKISDEIKELQKEKIENREIFDSKRDPERNMRHAIRDIAYTYEDIELTKRVSKLIYYSKEALFQYKNKKKVDSWLDSIENLKNRLDEIQTDPSTIDHLLNNISGYTSVAKEMGDIVIRESNILVLEDEKVRSLNQIIEKQGLMGEKRQKRSDDLASSLNNTSQESSSNLIMALFVVMFVLISMIFFLFVSVDRPLHELTHTINEVSKGNFDVTIDKKSYISEIRDIKESLGKILTSMKLYVLRSKKKR